MVPTAENAHTEPFDLVVIGGGPAGYAAALYGASAGLDIALVEKHKVGGTCLHVGCIPAKELLETASVYRTVKGASAFGVVAGEPSLEWSVTLTRKQNIVDQLFKGLSGLLKGRKVTMFDGVGSLKADRTVRVSGGASGDVELKGQYVLLATGSVPRTIPGFDIDGELVVTSDELLSIPALPERAVVIGGGAIGCEFASMMADLGTKVTILEALPKLLPGCDEDITNLVVRSFKKRSIDVRTGVIVSGHTPGPSGTKVSFGDGETIEVDLVVIAVGRRPHTDGLGLDGTAVKLTDRGYIDVDKYCRTAEPNVFGAGDVIATPALAHVGFAEGILVAKQILGDDPLPIDYSRVPWCIYCHPEVAFTGLSEQQAKEAGFDVVVSKHRFIGNGRALIVGEPDGMVKIIAEKQADGTGGRILGVHMVGPWVTEQLGQAYLSVNWEATVAEVAEFIWPHPTMSELFGESVLALTGRSLHG
ncbi:MAG: dihydrolipoyl dehydrogenase [Acidimicrobiales bacterium]|nr:dihydrolipoyl dehydrogenase [Acidimicrobiales bacterium]